MAKITNKMLKAEIVSLIEIRQDTIEQDPDSADEFESVQGNLEDLKYKIVREGELNEEETQWVIQELETAIDKANGNRGHGNDKDIIRYVRSLRYYINTI